MTSRPLIWGRAWFGKATRSEFLHQIVGTLGTRAIGIALGLGTSVVIARTLGAEGRGVLAIATALTAVAVQLGNVGLHVTNTLAVARDRRLLGPLLGNSLAVAALLGAVVAVLAFALGALRPGSLPISGGLLVLAVLGVPLGLAGLFSQNLLLGIGRVRAFNMVDLSGRGLGILATIVVVLIGIASPFSFMLAGSATQLFVIAVTILYLGRAARGTLRPSLGLFRADLSVGFKAYLTALMAYLVIRVDLFLIQSYRGFSDVGMYTVATAMGDLFTTLPIVIGTLLFPRMAGTASPRDQYLLARRTTVRVAVAMTGLGVVATVLAGPAIELLYGPAFAAATPAFWWLAPGLVALSIHMVLMNYFTALGLPRAALAASVVGLGINIALNLVLLPALGIVGASLASTGAYAAMLAISAWAFRRRGLALAAANAPGA